MVYWYVILGCFLISLSLLSILAPSAENSTQSSSYLVAFFFQIKYGGVVPKSYYIKYSVDVQYEKCITISRGSDHQLEYEVLVPNCLLRWVMDPFIFFYIAFLFFQALFILSFIHSFMLILDGSLLVMVVILVLASTWRLKQESNRKSQKCRKYCQLHVIMHI